MKTTQKATYKILQVTNASLNFKNEIQPIFAGDKLQDICQKMKKKYPHFYELKPFIKNA